MPSDGDDRVLTARFEMKCRPDELVEFKAAAHRRELTLSAFVREAARAAARGSELEPLSGFTPEELHVVWVATAQYLTSIATGETVIVTDREQGWPKWLGTALEKLTRAKNGSSSRAAGAVAPKPAAQCDACGHRYFDPNRARGLCACGGWVSELS